MVLHKAICTLIRKMEAMVPPFEPAAAPAALAAAPPTALPATSLADLRVGQSATVAGIAPGPLRLRLHELGFVPGARVRLVRRAPLRDPLQVEVCGYHLSLRVSEARGVRVDAVA